MGHIIDYKSQIWGSCGRGWHAKSDGDEATPHTGTSRGSWVCPNPPYIGSRWASKMLAWTCSNNSVGACTAPLVNYFRLTRHSNPEMGSMSVSSVIRAVPRAAALQHDRTFPILHASSLVSAFMLSVPDTLWEWHQPWPGCVGWGRGRHLAMPWIGSVPSSPRCMLFSSTKITPKRRPQESWLLR